MVRTLAWVGVALLTLAAVPACAGDADAGKAVFNKCRVCHSVDAGKNLVGPTLHGLFGRKAGAVENFRYSAAMTNSGIVWDEEKLAQYLTNPQAMVRGTKMAFIGLKDAKEREDVIAYLKKATK